MKHAEDDEEVFFSVANPVSKDLFLETYKDIACAAQLLLVPIGTIYHFPVTHILGNGEALEEYTRVFRSWEEVVSRAVYARKGIPDDRVAASMHQFLEVDKDQDVISTISAEAESIAKLLNTPDVIEMPVSVRLSSATAALHSAAQEKLVMPLTASETWLYGRVEMSGADGDIPSLNLCTPGVTAVLIARVLDAIATIGEGIDPPKCWSSKYSCDEVASQMTSVQIRRRAFAPVDMQQLSLPAIQSDGVEEHGSTVSDSREGMSYTSHSAGGLSIKTVDALLSALVIQVPTLPPTDVRLTPIQYYTLLDLYGTSPEVTDVLARRFQIDVPKAGLSLLDLLRAGVEYAPQQGPSSLRDDGTFKLSVSVGVDPVVSAVLQLRNAEWITAAAAKLKHLDSGVGSEGNGEIGHSEEPTDPEMAARAHRNAVQLAVITRLTKAQTQAKRRASCGREGGYLRAAVTIRRALRAAQMALRKVVCVGPEGTVSSEYSDDGSDEDDESTSINDNSSEDEDDKEDGEEKEKKEEIWNREMEVELEPGDDDGDIVRALGIPLALHTRLLCDRAVYLLETFKERQASLDYRAPTGADDPLTSPLLLRARSLCDRAIGLDMYCTPAYACRASIGGIAGQCELEYTQEIKSSEERHAGRGSSHDDGSEGYDVVPECHTLRSAAKDALAAFLLGGSTDLSLAGAAEDAAREASRVAAKAEFRHKHADAEAVDPDGAPSLRLPKAWLVQAYLAGYLPPALAFQVPPLLDYVAHESISDEQIAELANLHWALLDASLCSGPGVADQITPVTGSSMEDIDESDAASHFPAELPLPPSELLDSTSSPLVEENDAGSPDCHAYDRQAYRLLRQLCDLLQAATKECANAASSAPDIHLDGRSFLAAAYAHKQTAKEQHKMDYGSTINVSVLTDRELFLEKFNPPQNVHTLALQGLCEISACRDDSELDSAAYSSGADAMRVLPMLELAKEAPASGAFAAFVKILMDARVFHLTGVRFHPVTAHVAEVTPVAEEEEEVWEDEDSDCSSNKKVCEKEENEQQQEPESINVSGPLRARLLSLCAVAAYLLGDAKGSVLCLRTSLRAQPLPSTSLYAAEAGPETLASVDAAIKLGALLVDMDERQEAREVLDTAVRGAQAVHGHSGGLRAAAMCAAMLHYAELDIHELSYDEAIDTLAEARREVERMQYREEQDEEDGIEKTPEGEELSKFLRLLHANISSLQGVALYRHAPQQPDEALYVLRNACQQHPKQLYLLLCYGEVLSQLGDLVGSLSCFEAAHRLHTSNPLPFVNAARTYQQMSQPGTSDRHLQCAVAIDPSFALTQIDVAQGLLHRGATQEALHVLDYALQLSRHVSDICDVLTAKTVATLQAELQAEGIYTPPPQRDLRK